MVRMHRTSTTLLMLSFKATDLTPLQQKPGGWDNEHRQNRRRILQQIAAIRGAVNGLMVEVLEGQIREHVAAGGLTAEEREQEVNQVAAVLRSYLK